MTGLEIGALCWPAVRKAEGDILYVDHTDAANLRKSYASDPAVDVSQIVEVDAIWGDQTLSSAIDGRRVDYVIASHVAEHVPDLITWLQEVHSILQPRGQLRLALPDKRFSWDYLRAETDISAVLAAYAVKARRPQVREVVDFKVHAAPSIDNLKIYSGEYGPADVTPLHDLAHVLWCARAIINDPKLYIDVHCWVFTPRSFALLMAQMARFGLLDLACVDFTDSAIERGFEFFISLTPSTDRQATIDSWMLMAQGVSDPLPGTGAAAAKVAAKEEALHAAHALRVAEGQVAALLDSNSWRITAPLRWLARRIRG